MVGGIYSPNHQNGRWGTLLSTGTLVLNLVGEEKTLVDGDVCGVLVGGGVDGALIRVPFPANMGIATLLLVVPLLLLLLPPLVIAPALSLDIGEVHRT